MTGDVPQPAGTEGASIVAPYWPKWSESGYVQAAGTALTRAGAATKGVETATQGATAVPVNSGGQTSKALTSKFTELGTELTTQATRHTAEAQNLAINAQNHFATKTLLNGVATDYDAAKEALVAMGIATGTPQPTMQKNYDELKTAADTAGKKVGESNQAAHKTATEGANNGTSPATSLSSMPGTSDIVKGLPTALQSLAGMATSGPQLVTGTAGSLISGISGMAGPLVQQLAQHAGGGEGGAKPGEPGAPGGDKDKPGGAQGAGKPEGAGGGPSGALDKPGGPGKQSDSLDVSNRGEGDKGDPRPGGGGGAGAAQQASHDKGGGAQYTETRPDGAPEDKDVPKDPPRDAPDRGEAPARGEDTKAREEAVPASERATAGADKVTSEGTTTHLSSGVDPATGGPATQQGAATVSGAGETFSEKSNVVGLGDGSRTGGDAPAGAAAAPDPANPTQTHTSSGAAATMAPSTSLSGAPAGAPMAGGMGGLGGGLGAPVMAPGVVPMAGPAGPVAPMAPVAPVNVAPAPAAPAPAAGPVTRIETATGGPTLPSAPAQAAPQQPAQGGGVMPIGVPMPVPTVIVEGHDPAAEEPLAAFDPAVTFGTRILGRIVRNNPFVGAAAVAVYPPESGQYAITLTSDALGIAPGGVAHPQWTVPLAALAVPDAFRSDWAGAADPGAVLSLAAAAGLIPTPETIVSVDTQTDTIAAIAPDLVQQVSVKMVSRVEPVDSAELSPEPVVAEEHVLGILDQMTEEWQVPEGISLADAVREMQVRRWTQDRNPEYLVAMIWWMVTEAKIAHAAGDVPHATSLAWQLLALPPRA